MLTLGVDLASQDCNTAVCAVRWRDEAAEIVRLGAGAGNKLVLELVAEADATGIDAPFGWPARFVAAVGSWARGERWPESWDADTVRMLRLRETDRWVHGLTGKWPLSVSADSIAVCAMRAAVLLDAAGAGTNRVHGSCFEVYPAAALVAWDLVAESARYKRDEGARARLLDAIAPERGWLSVAAAERAACIGSDHLLDSLLCALVARAAATRRTHAPPAELDEGVVAAEGWIHVPLAASLDRLRLDHD